METTFSVSQLHGSKSERCNIYDGSESQHAPYGDSD